MIKFYLDCILDNINKQNGSSYKITDLIAHKYRNFDNNKRKLINSKHKDFV